MKIDKKTLLGIAILVVCVVAVEIYFGWLRLLAPWRDVSVGTLIATLTLTFATYVLRALRVYDYFRAALRGQFMLCLKLTLQHNLLNNFLPMRAGEISFPVLMSRYFDVHAAVSVPVLLWFRLIDLHTLVAIALLAAGELWFESAYIFPLFMLWLTLPIITYSAHQRFALLLGDTPTGIRKKLASALASLPQSKLDFLRAWLWTWINWLVKLSVFTWVLLLFAAVPWSAAGLAAIAGDLSSVLPIHGVAGAGTYEASVVAALLPAGLPADLALQAAVNLHLFLLGSTLLGGGIALFMPGRKISHAA